MSSPQDATAPAATPLRAWLGVVTLALGVFAFTTSEMVPIGLLTTIGGDLQVSEGATGLSVTLYGIIAGLFAPVLTSATRRIDRRTLIALTLVVFVVGNSVTALATNYPVLLGSRLLTGFAHGVMWSIAASIAVRLVAPQAITKAIAVVFSGISVASVLGVPFGTFLGDTAGWRSAFWVIVAFGALTLVASLLLVPSMEPAGVVRLGEIPKLLRVPALRIAVAVAVLVVIGHFAAYTYITPFLEQVTGIETRWISLLLLVYGIAGVAGNFLSGYASARALTATLISCALGVGISVALMVLVGNLTVLAVVLLLAWGVFYTALPVALQTLVFSSVPHAPEAATSLFVLAFNVSIALGALVGGVTIDSAGVIPTMLVGALLALIAAVVMVLGRRARGVAGDATPADAVPDEAGDTASTTER